MNRAALLTALGLSLGASQVMANCEKIAYVESVRAYAGGSLNSHIFVRETGVTSPLFVASTKNADFVRAALQAHVNRMPVRITTRDAVCPLAGTGLWTALGAPTRVVLAP